MSHDFKIPRGDPFSKTFIYRVKSTQTPIDLTNWTFKFKIGRGDNVQQTYTDDVNSNLTISPLDGIINLQLSEEEIEDLDELITKSIAYKLVGYPPTGAPQLIIQGTLCITGEMEL